MKWIIKNIASVAIIGTTLLSGCSGDRLQKPEIVKVGVALSLSGNGSAAGDYTLKGIQLAIKEQNEKGGLLGKRIELDIQDSKGDPKTGVDIVKKMVEGSERPFLICSNTSGVSLAIKPETEKNKIILLGSAATDKLLEGSGYIVRNYVESGQISDDILTHVNNSQLKSMGVFYSNNEFGNSVSTKIREKSIGLGITLPFTTSYDDKELDYKSIIAAADLKSAPSIYVIGLGKSLGTFIKQLREAGYKGQIIGDPLFNNPDTISAAGEAAKQVAYLDFNFDKNSTNGAVLAFVKAYRKEFNTDPQNLAAITYDALKMIFKNVEESKTLNPDELMLRINTSNIVDGAVGNSSVKSGNILYPTTFKVME